MGLVFERCGLLISPYKGLELALGIEGTRGVVD